MKKNIYIIKNKINDKCYIGQSVDYLTRFRKHCEEARRNNYTYKSYLYNAMNELGIENFYVELLESQVEDYNEKEIYYIEKYNTLRPNGYNLVKGGDWYPNLSGIEHHNAKITSQEMLDSIYDELLNSNYSLEEIAKHHKVNYNVIQHINAGDTYKSNRFQYPLRECVLTKEKLDRLTYDLKYSNYSHQELSDIYEISLSQISNINQGRSWYRDYLEYPIRCSCFVGTDDIIEKIQKDLLSTSLSYPKLAEKYKCSKQTIQRINSGETYKNEKLKYPLRKTGKLTSQDIEEIYNLLIENKISINEIAAKYYVSDATIKRINSGKTKKYKKENYKYPLRKL